MAVTLDAAYENSAFDGQTNNGSIQPSDNHTNKQTMINMRDGDTMEIEMSADGAQTLAALSSRITVTFHNVSKVISVPAKMIDPTSKERFIQRTLLDNVSGQIHPRQIVALMGPSGIVIEYLVVFFLHRDLYREWKNNSTKYVVWSSAEWCDWKYLVQ